MNTGEIELTLNPDENSIEGIFKNLDSEIDDIIQDLGIDILKYEEKEKEDKNKIINYEDKQCSKKVELQTEKDSYRIYRVKSGTGKYATIKVEFNIDGTYRGTKVLKVGNAKEYAQSQYKEYKEIAQEIRNIRKYLKNT